MMEMFFCASVIIFECIEVYICLHICFKSKVMFGKIDLFYYVAYLGYYAMVNTMNLWLGMDIVFAVIIFLWCLKKFGKTVWKTLMCYLSGIAFSGAIQMFSAYFLEPINQRCLGEWAMAFLGISSLVGCGIAIALYKLRLS